MTAKPVPISVIILTHDEVVNIGPCLESLSAFDDIVVVDSGSRDGTLETLATRFADVRVLHHPFEDFGQQRNWALDHAKVQNEWVLFFDADERATPPFVEALRRAVAEPNGHDGFFLCYRNFFLDRWIKRCTLFPTWQLRLLRAGRVRYRKEGHGQREVMDGTAGFIDVPYDHFGFSKGIADWVARHNSYSTNEVDLILRLSRESLVIADVWSREPVRRRRALKTVAARIPLRPLARFLYLYFFRCGFLDGRAGLVFCLLRMAQEVHIVAKLEEAKRATAAASDTTASTSYDVTSVNSCSKSSNT